MLSILRNRSILKKMKLLIIILSLAIIGTFSTAYAELQQIKITTPNPGNFKHIGIEWSKSCEYLISLNDVKTCSSKDMIKSFYPDTKLKADYQKSLNSIKDDPQKIFKANNYIKKNKLDCISRDYCNLFAIKHDQKVLFWFDPDQDARGYLDFIITIQSNMSSKNISLKGSPITDNGTTRTISFNTHDLYVHSCDRAIIKSNQLDKDLGKIIYYALGNCQNPAILGNLKDNYSETISKHILDITTSPNWQAKQKMQADIMRCKVKC